MLPSLHLGEINSGIHMCQITFEHPTLFFDVVLVSDVNKNFWRIDGFGEKRHGSADLDSSVPLMHHVPDRSRITVPNPDRRKERTLTY